MTINYLCPDGSIQSGGIKVIYDHVALLNKNGFKAQVIHEEGERADWFDNDVPITDKIKVNKDDVLVAPEGYGKRIMEEFSQLDCKKVILAQSWSYIVPSFNYDVSRLNIQDWKDAGFEKVLAVSQLVKRVVGNLFGYEGKYITYCPHYADQIFNDDSEPKMENKEKSIIFFPRKNQERDDAVLLMLLQMKPLYMRGWNILPVSGVKQQQVADLMKRSAIFLTTSDAEGFGLPILEAFAANAIAVGHTGLGSEEFFKNGFEDKTNTIYNTAKLLKKAVELFDRRDGRWEETIRRQRLNLKRYTREKTEKILIEFYKNI